MAMPGPGSVLIATTGDESTIGAIRVGCAYAARRRVPVEAFTVLDHLPTTGANYCGYGQTADAEHGASVETNVRTQLDDVAPGMSIPIVAQVGSPAETIAERARTIGARLIVLGLCRHRAVDRLLGVEVDISMVRCASAPVLAVSPDAPVHLGVVVVATDFDPAAARAARMALDLAADDAVVHLVHVTRTLDPSIDHRFSELLGTLSPPPDGQITPHILQGDPAPMVAAFARRHGASLIALGCHGKGFIDRLLGSCAESVMRTACCSVLITS
jgi:nucleotide-binding universal stress UspA family protein